MKIVTCASYNYSGSSAVTDLFAEYSNVQDNTDYEFRFIHDPDGVSDLEFHLCECHNRENSGHALKRFLKLSRFNDRKIHSQYKRAFNSSYMKITEDYVNSLTDFSYNGWWFFDLYDKGFFLYHLGQFANHFLGKFGIRIMKKEKIYCSHPTVEDFINKTQEYTHRLFLAANPRNMEYTEFDQLLPSQNIARTLRYFKDDVYVIVVDRDPRDIFCLYRFIHRDNNVGFKTAEDFCRWFRYVRESGIREYDSEKILHLRLEDLIFKYEETVDKVEKFTGMKNTFHTGKFSRFNPKKSVNNTRLFTKYSGIDKEIKIIEKSLSEYLYDYDSVSFSDIPGIETGKPEMF